MNELMNGYLWQRHACRRALAAAYSWYPHRRSFRREDRCMVDHHSEDERQLYDVFVWRRCHSVYCSWTNRSRRSEHSPPALHINGLSLAKTTTNIIMFIFLTHGAHSCVTCVSATLCTADHEHRPHNFWPWGQSPPWSRRLCYIGTCSADLQCQSVWTRWPYLWLALIQQGTSTVNTDQIRVTIEIVYPSTTAGACDVSLP